ncbi:class I SAM-dependent methyltransferase [Amnibacterium sp.]|uniref:class I SAM-dependent DNA methyltransferase n=1 Tax=Amnibacterium sp. TaxID=1872496 RepID=UPI002630ED12|nr:class I SAM-dependent methyltransferase [Amnibacterium sp.]MCU1473440.1 SAM-dependent methyltransferase [Amnibacterium sp.]
MRSEDEVRRFYDAVAPRYAELLPGPTAEQPVDLGLLTAFARDVAATADAVVLDAGCGTGRLTRLLQDAGLRSIGFDPSPGMLAIARARFPETRFEVGGLAALPVPDATVDGVLAWYSIIHTPAARLDPVVSELARVLRPGGVVLLGFQAGTGTRRIERGYGTEATTTAVLHDPQDVANRLGGGGFAVDEVVRRAAARERHDQGFVRAHLAGA